MVSNINTAESLFFADKVEINELANEMDTDDVPSTSTANSEEYDEQVMLMHGLDYYQTRIVNPPNIPYEDTNSTRVGWKTK